MSAQTVQRWPADLPVHPAAELFPLMAGEDFAELVADIRLNGLIEPIVRTEDEEILDGRNRLLACCEADVPMVFATFIGDPWAFVISTNLHRRHLTDTQRAVIAGKLADRHEGRPKTASIEAVCDEPPTRKEAAQLLHVSRTAVERARRVLRSGTPALQELTEGGQVPLSTAERVSKLPDDDQDAFADKVAHGMSPRAAAPPEQVTGPHRPEGDNKRRRARSTGDVHILGRDALSVLASEMSSLDLALKPVTSIDPDAEPADFVSWERDLTKGIRALHGLRKLVKARLGDQLGDQQP